MDGYCSKQCVMEWIYEMKTLDERIIVYHRQNKFRSLPLNRMTMICLSGWCLISKLQFLQKSCFIVCRIAKNDINQSRQVHNLDLQVKVAFSAKWTKWILPLGWLNQNKNNSTFDCAASSVITLLMFPRKQQRQETKRLLIFSKMMDYFEFGHCGKHFR